MARLPGHRWRFMVASMSNTQRTVDSYELSAREYDALCVNDPPPGIAAVLRRFAEVLPLPAIVLEVGSGPGRDADFLETLGVRVRRTDATQAFLDIQAERGRQGDLLNVETDELGGPYDGFLGMCVLIHIGREQTDAVLARILRALKPGGALLISMRVGDHEEIDRCHTIYWTRDAYAERLHRAGFTLLWDTHFVDSANDPWTIYCARR